MPADVFESAIELRIPLLEALPPNSASYPYPSLRRTSESGNRTFRTLVLENAYLRAEFVTDLGGRLIQLYDKRQGRELLGFSPDLEVENGSSRGVRLTAGLQFQLAEEDRPNSMGSVAWQLLPPEDEESGAGLVLAETGTTGGLSWHLTVSLEPDEATFTFEARILNRTGKALPYNAGFATPIEARIAFVSEQLGANCHRFGSIGSISPRQVDVWSARLLPSAHGQLAVTVSGSLGRHADSLVLLASKALGKCRILLADGDGKTHEATAEVRAESLEMPLQGLDPKAISIVDSSGAELVAWPALPTVTRTAPPSYELSGHPHDALFDVATRHLAHIALAKERLGKQQYSEANQHLEQALLFNAEDHLAWWAKAVTMRLMGVQEDERPELPNAHFLAPLEPALRAEAFLAQQQSSPLLEPLRDTPDDLVEIACLLIEHNLWDQAHRFLDEAVALADLAMLRYLSAYVLLKATTMEVEAAAQVQAAERAQLPPYPWRAAEMEALAMLAGRFPQSQHLAQLLK